MDDNSEDVLNGTENISEDVCDRLIKTDISNRCENDVVGKDNIDNIPAESSSEKNPKKKKDKKATPDSNQRSVSSVLTSVC